MNKEYLAKKKDLNKLSTNVEIISDKINIQEQNLKNIDNKHTQNISVLQEDLNTAKTNFQDQIDNIIIETDKFHENIKAKTGYYFYNVTDYGILPNTGDIYSALYDLMAEKVRYTGGVVYFPRGLYTLSNTIFIPENTTFYGDGEDTEIYFDETNVNFGTGLSNAGSNVTIKNIKVTQKTTGEFKKGSAPGCIGFSDITINQYDLPKDTTELSRGPVENLIAENVYFGESNYAIQTEPSIHNSIYNVIYRNLVAENGCVSIMVCSEDSVESIHNVIIENVICDLIRVEERAMRHIGNVSIRNVICNNFYLNANRDSTGMITVDNMSQTGNVCNNVYSSGLINGNITLRGCKFKNNESKVSGIDVGSGIHYFYNCIFDMYMKVFTRLISLSDSDYMHIENCSIKLSGATRSSVLVGYGRNNIYYDADSKIKNLLFGDCYAELKSIGAQAVTAKHNNTINIRDDNLYISVHAQMTDNSAVFTLNDKAKALPLVGDKIPVIIYNNADRTGTQVNTYAKIENGVLKIQEPGYETGNGYDRILIHAPLELTRKPTPLEIYAAFG